MSTETTTTPRVRPRWVWGGLLLLLAGAVLIGLGVAFGSWTWAIIGIVVLAVGGALSTRGGIMKDAHQQGIGEELRQAVHGETREGIEPGESIVNPRAQRTSKELDLHRREVLAASHRAPKPPFANMGAALVLAVCVFLLAAQWAMYPLGHTPQVNGFWSEGFMIISGAAGLRIMFGNPGRHNLSVFVILASGVGLLLRAFLAAHTIEDTAIAEGVCGVLLVLGGLLAMVSPALEVEELPTQRHA